MSKSQQDSLPHSCLHRHHLPTQSQTFAMMAGPGLLAPTPTPVFLTLQDIGRHSVTCTVASLKQNPFSLAFTQPLRSERIGPFKLPVSFLTFRKHQYKGVIHLLSPYSQLLSHPAFPCA